MAFIGRQNFKMEVLSASAARPSHAADLLQRLDALARADIGDAKMPVTREETVNVPQENHPAVPTRPANLHHPAGARRQHRFPAAEAQL